MSTSAPSIATRSGAVQARATDARRISVSRRGTNPTTATSSAADLALARLVDERRRRNKYGPAEVPAQSVVGDAIGGVSSLVDDSLVRLGVSRRTFAAVAVVAAIGLVSFAAIRSIPRESNRHELAGNVSFNGRPLAQAVLEFHATGPAEGGEPFYVKVETDPSGEFRRPAALGVPPGSYAVVVKSGRIMPHPDAEVGQPIKIPARYTSVSSTPFTVEVTKHSSRFDLSLRR